jgi:hypothetical protein
MSITLLDKDALEVLRSEIEEALKSIATKNGLKELRIGTIRYTPDLLSFNGQVICKIDASGNPEAKKAQDDTNEQYSKMIGFNKNIVGEKFKNRGRDFEITEINPGRSKYPITATDSEGNRYRFPIGIVFINKEIKRL